MTIHGTSTAGAARSSAPTSAPKPAATPAMSKARAQVAAFSPAPVCASSSDLLLAAGCSAPDHTLEVVLPLRTAVCDRPTSNVCTDRHQVNPLPIGRAHV